MTRVVLSRRALFPLGLLIAPQPARSEQQWISYLSVDGSYQIDYPDKSPVSTATPQKLANGDPTGFTLNSASLMLSASLSFISNSVGLGRFVLPDVQLDAAIDRLKVLPNAKLESVANVSVKNYPGRRVKSVTTNGKVLYDTLIVCTKKTQITALAVYASTLFEVYPETKDIVAHYFQSLTILE